MPFNHVIILLLHVSIVDNITVRNDVPKNVFWDRDIAPRLKQVLKGVWYMLKNKIRQLKLSL